MFSKGFLQGCGYAFIGCISLTFMLWIAGYAHFSVSYRDTVTGQITKVAW